MPTARPSRTPILEKRSSRRGRASYFAVQTRRQELTDQEQLLGNEQRLLLREDLRLRNSQLADAAMRAGVVEPIDYAIFQNHGYRGLYNGLDQAGFHRRKGLKKNHDS